MSRKDDNRIHAKAIWDARRGNKPIKPAPPRLPRKDGGIIERALAKVKNRDRKSVV